jgi:autotransporter-associated beta strand protein
MRAFATRITIAVIKTLQSLFALIVLATSAHSATVTWDGAVGPAWSDPGNWGGTAPTVGDTLVFPAGPAQLATTNDLPAGTAFAAIVIGGSGYTLDGAAASVPSLTSSGSSSVSLPLSLTGAAIVDSSSGTLSLSSVSAAGTSLALQGAGAITIDALSGAVVITKPGAGTVTIDGANASTGGMTISAGTLVLASSSADGAGGIIVGDGASVQLVGGITLATAWTMNGAAPALESVSGDNTCTGNMSLTSASTSAQVQVDAATLRLNGAISGPGGITKLGAGELRCDAFDPGGATNGSFKGPLLVNAGRLATMNHPLYGSPPVTVANGAQLSLIGSGALIGIPLNLIGGAGADGRGALVAEAGSTWMGPITIGMTTTIGVETPDPGTFDVFQISGAGNLIKRGPGHLGLKVFNTFTGYTSVQEGTLDLSTNLSYAVPNSLTIAAGATVTCNGPAQIQPGKQVTVDGTLDIGQNSESIGFLLGSGHVRLGNAGMLALTGGGIFTGSLDDGAQVPGTGGLVTLGANIAFSAPGTYSGTILVPAPTLEVDGSLPDTKVVLSGGTLRGTGTLGGIIATSGTIFPGDTTGPGGVLTCRSLAMAQQSTLFIEYRPAARHYEQIVVLEGIILDQARFWVNYPPDPGALPVLIDNRSNSSVAGRAIEYGPDPTPISYQGGDGNDIVLEDAEVEQASSQVDPASTSPVIFAVTFAYPVNDFTAADVLLSGTAHPSTATLHNSAIGASATYTVDVGGMDRSGTVIASVSAGTVHFAGMPVSASFSEDNVVQFTAPQPSVAVAAAPGQADPGGGPNIDFAVTFSSAVSGFSAAGIQLSGSAAPTTTVITGSGASYTVTVSGMSGSGDVTISVLEAAAHDAGGFINTASSAATIAYAAPSSTGGSATSAGPPPSSSGSGCGMGGGVVAIFALTFLGRRRQR